MNYICMVGYILYNVNKNIDKRGNKKCKFIDVSDKKLIKCYYFVNIYLKIYWLGGKIIMSNCLCWTNL